MIWNSSQLIRADNCHKKCFMKANKVVGISKDVFILLECSLYMKSTSKLHVSISSKPFLFNVQVWEICLNLIDLSKKRYNLFIEN